MYACMEPNEFGTEFLGPGLDGRTRFMFSPPKYKYKDQAGASRAQRLTELRYGIILRDYITELYYGIILRDTVMELYYGRISRDNITELYYGIMLRDNVTEIYYGMLNITG